MCELLRDCNLAHNMDRKKNAGLLVIWLEFVLHVFFFLPSINLVNDKSLCVFYS